MPPGGSAPGWETPVLVWSEVPAARFDLVEEHVRQVRPAHPEATSAALLLALELAPTWEQFLEAQWVGQVPVHHYTHFEGGGIGDVRALAIVERFVRWLGGFGGLEPWDEARLLHAVEQARRSVAATPRELPSAHDQVVRLEDVCTRVIAPFAATAAPSGFPLGFVEAAATALAPLAVAPNTRLVRFGALDPLALFHALFGAAERGDVTVAEPTRFGHDVLRVAIAFYRWLAATGRLEASRAQAIAYELEQLLLVPAYTAACC